LPRGEFKKSMRIPSRKKKGKKSKDSEREAILKERNDAHSNRSHVEGAFDRRRREAENLCSETGESKAVPDQGGKKQTKGNWRTFNEGGAGNDLGEGNFHAETKISPENKTTGEVAADGVKREREDRG